MHCCMAFALHRMQAHCKHKPKDCVIHKILIVPYAIMTTVKCKAHVPLN